MTYAQKNEDEKGKNLKNVTKRNLKMIMIIIINNNDYNDSDRKGKELKVATKKTASIKTTSLPDF